MAERGLTPAGGWPDLHCASHEKPFPCPDCVAARSEAEGVERFDRAPGAYAGMRRVDTGGYVQYSDYEKLEAAFDKQSRTAWRLEREVERASDRIGDARDQARQEVLEEVADAADYLHSLGAQERREGDASEGSPQHQREVAKAEGYEHAAEYLHTEFDLATLDPSGEDCERCGGSGTSVDVDLPPGHTYPEGTITKVTCPHCPSGEQGEEGDEESWPPVVLARHPRSGIGRVEEQLQIVKDPKRYAEEKRRWPTRQYVPASHQRATDTSKEEQGGVKLIAAERERQVCEEDWTPEHDDKQEGAELVDAAVALALEAEQTCGTGNQTLGGPIPSAWWPWHDDGSWKPSDDPIRNLTRAGALIAAEIDRRLRASSKEVQGDG